MANKSHDRALNDRQLGALKPVDDKQFSVSNLGERGLSLTVSYGGTKVFYYRYSTHEGRQKRIKLGSYPDLSLSEARELARAHRVCVDQGGDPAREKRKRRTEAQSRKIATVGDLWRDYRLRAGEQKRSADFELSIWRTHIEKHFQRLDVRDYTRAAIMDFLDDVRLEKSATLANRVQALLTRLARHAMDRRVFDVNPAHNLGTKPRENSRTRVLSEAELRTFWKLLCSPTELRGPCVSPTMALALKLVTLTLCRRNEVAGAKWDEVDFDQRVWIIPADRVKNGRDHVVPLSDQAMLVLRNAREIAFDDCRYVFASSRTSNAIRADSITRACRRISEHVEFESFRPHDLRRTGATLLTSEVLGVNRFLVSQILNHARDTGGTASIFGTYDRNDYLSEKRKGLDRWGEFIAGAANVTWANQR